MQGTAFPNTPLQSLWESLWYLWSAMSNFVTAIEQVERSVKHYQRALDRLKGRWQGVGSDGERYRDSKHPYANDLDLFGPGSLFELITRCQTRLGEDRIAEWFRAPSSQETITARQQAIQELAENVTLREELEVLPPSSQRNG